MFFKHCLVVVGVIAALGCGGSGSQSGAGPSITSFTATPASLPAGGGNVTLSWSVTGGNSLSIDQGVGDVSGMTSKVVAVTSSKTFTLTASNSTGSNIEHASVSVAASLTVTGKVVNQFNQPVSGVKVSIPGKASVTTDVNGSFTFSAVTAPYDVYIVDNTYKAITAYKGLTRADPTLWSVSALSGAAHAALVAGTVQAGGVGTYPQPAGYHTAIAFTSAETTLAGLTNASGAFSLIPQWYGPTSAQGSLHALQVRESAPGIPVEYKGYGKLDLITSNGGSYTAQNVALSAVSTGTLGGSVAAPPGYILHSKIAYLALNPSPKLQLALDTSLASTFSFLVPVISNSSLVLLGYAEKAGATFTYGWKAPLAPNASGVNLVLRSGAEASLPVSGATGIGTTSSFSWSGLSEGVHQIAFIPGTAGNPTFYVFTTGTETTIPDGATFGLPLPSAANYYWVVNGYAPFPTIDAAASLDFLARLNLEIAADSYTSNSSPRPFTTQP